MKPMLITIAAMLLATPAWAQSEACIKGSRSYPACLLKNNDPNLPPPKDGPIPGSENYYIRPFDSNTVKMPNKIIVN